MLQTRTSIRRPPEEVAELVERTSAGDPAACNCLIEEFAGLVWAVTRAYGLSPADAADAAQTTWLRFVERIDELRDPAKLGGWLSTIARRECLNMLRHQKRVQPQEDLPEPIELSPAQEAAVIAAEERATLWTALERLRPRDRALLRMLVADPAPSYEEIGAALEMPIGSIGPTRARALARLRREAELLGLSDEALCD